MRQGFCVWNESREEEYHGNRRHAFAKCRRAHIALLVPWYTSPPPPTHCIKSSCTFVRQVFMVPHLYLKSPGHHQVSGASSYHYLIMSLFTVKGFTEPCRKCRFFPSCIKVGNITETIYPKNSSSFSSFLSINRSH